MSIFGGAGAASAAPVLTLDSPLDGQYIPETDTTFYTISGTTSGDNKVSLSVTNAEGTTVQYPDCDTTFSGGDGVPWSCNIAATALSIGANIIVATSDYSFAPSDPSTVTSNFFVYDTDPTITLLTPGPSGTDRQPLISGTGPAYGSMVVSVCDAVTGPGADGYWECTPTNPLAFGTNGITVDSQTNQSENYSGTSIEYTVEIPVPNPSYGDGAANVSIVMGAPIDDLEPHNYVTPVLPVAGESEGPCSDAICSFPLDPGVVRIDSGYQATDGSGATGAFRRDYWRTPDAPTMNTPEKADFNVINFSGTATTDGDLVRVSDNSSYVCQDIVEGGAWACSISNPGVGDHNYAAITQSQGFDATAAGIVDPEMGASYNGYSAPTPPALVRINSLFSLAYFDGYAGDLVEIYGVRPANEPNFRIMLDQGGVLTDACVPTQPIDDQSFSCFVDTTIATQENSILVAGVWDEGTSSFDPETTGTAEFRILQPTTIDQVGDADDYLYNDVVTVTGTTLYPDGTLTVELNDATCEAPVTAGTWSCELSMLETDDNAVVSVYRGSPTLSTQLAAQGVHVITPPTVNLDDTDLIYSYSSDVVVTGSGHPFDGEFSTAVTVDVSGNGITPFTCTTDTAGSGEGEGNPDGYFECDLGELPNGEYDLVVRQSPQWADPLTSDPVLVTLIVSDARDALQCAFSPDGGLTISSDQELSVGLYGIGEGTPDYNPANLGLCSGSVGSPSPGMFDDVDLGQCDTAGAEGEFSGDILTGCLASGLAPGMWNLYYGFSGGSEGEGGGGTQYDWFFVIPEAPTIVAVASTTTAGLIELSGAGVTGDAVTVRDATDTIVCTAEVVAETWSCAADVGPSIQAYRAYQTDAASGGISPTSSSDVIVVEGDPTIVVNDPQPSYTFHQGDPFTLTGHVSGVLPPGTFVTAGLVATPFQYIPFTCSPDSPDGFSCTLPTTPLPAGTYELRILATNGSTDSAQLNEVDVVIQSRAPGLVSSTNTEAVQDGEFTLTGTKLPESLVTVTVLVDGEPFAEFEPCADTIDVDKTLWQCDYSLEGLGLEPGSYGLQITQSLPGGESDPILPRPLLTVVAAVPPAPPVLPPTTPTPTPTPTPTETPAPPKVPLVWKLVMTGVDGPLRPGQVIGLSSSGIPAGSIVSAELHSTPVDLGGTVVKADGTFNYKVTIPMDVEEGDHEIIVTVTPPGDDPVPVNNAVQIVHDPPAKDRAVIESGHDSRAALIGTDNPRNDPASPTALTRSIPTIGQIFTNPIAIGLAGALALALLFLVAIPAEVLNSTLEANSGRFGRFFARVQDAVDRATAWFVRVTRTPAIAAAILVLVSSVVFGFIDPQFGFDFASGRLVVSVALALFIVTFVASRITSAIIKRAWDVESEIGMQPTAILFAVLGVIAARLLDFAPGFLIGLVIGLELAHQATDRQKLRSTVVKLGVIVGLSVVAWLGYSVIVALQGDGDATFFSAFAQDTLVAVTAEGLTAVMVAILPIGFLDGRELFSKSRRLWLLMFVVIALAFSLLVLPTALQGQNIGDIGWWMLVLVIFAAFTFALTFVMRATGAKASAPAREKADA